VFSHHHPYGVIFSSLILHLAREDDAALRDLYNWMLWTEKDLLQSARPDSARWIGLYRVLHLYGYIASRQGRAFRHLSLIAWLKAVELGEQIATGKGWRDKSDYIVNWKQRYARMPPSSRPVICNRTNGGDVFPGFYFSYLGAKNNFVHHAAVDYEFAKQLGIVDKAIRRAEELADIPFECLESDLTGKELLDELKEAISDTRIRMLLAYAKDEDGSEAKRKRSACTALELAKTAHAVLTPKARPLLALKPADVLKAPAIFEEHFDIVDDAQSATAAAEQLRAAQHLVKQLGAQDSC
jgi:hypothetical protein